MHFNILNHVAVVHECDRQTDGRRDITGFINRAVLDLFFPNLAGAGFLMANLGGYMGHF